MREQLSTGQLKAREAELQQRYQSIREEVERALHGSGETNLQELAGRVRDSGEESVADLIAGMKFSRVGHLAQELQAIEAAQARIREGSYGLCDECGNEIAPARLQALPSAVRCIECQSRIENEYGRNGAPSL